MLQLNFNLFPLIETERLQLRKITMDDAADFLALRSDIDAMKYIDRPMAKSIEDIYELIAKISGGIESNESIGWAMTIKNESKLFGTIGYHQIMPEHYRAEIGYMLHPSYWNKGYASEAIAKIIDYGFIEMKLHSIEAKINPGNLASANLLKKHSFVKEAYFKENYFYNDKFLDTEIYSLLTTLKA